MKPPQDSALQGHTVLLPEARQLQALETVISQLGADVFRYRVSDARSGSRTVERWLAELVEREFDDIIFATAQGVHLLTEFASALGKETDLLTALRAVRVITLGARPARALSELGVPVAIRSDGRSTDGLLRTLATLDLEGRVVGVQHWGQELDLRVSAYLESRGARPRMVANAPDCDRGAEELLERLLMGDSRSLVFTSVRQVTWLFEAFAVSGREHDLCRALERTRVLATESVAETLRSKDVRVQPVSSRTLIVLPRPSDIAAVFAGGEPLKDHPEKQASSSNSKSSAQPRANGKKQVVVIGNGMVGQRFCERLLQYDTSQQFEITTFCEEPRPAYDRVQLTKYFETRDPESLALTNERWFEENGIQLLLGQRAMKLDRIRKQVLSSDGTEIPYDYAILATGSSAFVPPVPGVDKTGVFVYRTIEDLDAIIEYAKRCKRAAVLGGGLLGLEAAKAVAELGLDTHVLEFAARLMPRQLDQGGAGLLARRIRELGVKVHTSKNTSRVMGEDTVTGLRYSDGERLDIDMLVISAGIRPRDDLARDSGLSVGERGGVVVDDQLRTSDEDIYAIGECALHRGSIYGLVGPGWEMADTLAKSMTGSPSEFSGADMSTKLKLMGVDVASFGDALASSERTIVYEDLVKGVYKKLVLSDDGERLLGGSLVGDSSEYAQLLHLCKSAEKLPEQPEALILGARGGAEFEMELPDSFQVCSCNNVTKGDIRSAISEKGLTVLADVKMCTTAGTGCGGCMPQLTDIFTAEMKKTGNAVKPVLCEHFEYTRQELFDLIKVKGYRSFEETLSNHGQGHGCEVCKPTIASILASVVNDLVVRHDHLQDTNDRFLANIQRQGVYSVVPRVPAGEITPDQLIALGQVAKKYNLYSKITGGQRVDLFGAHVGQLPDIWEELIAAGFESGHAYGKSLRTVKSCVGSTWCRYGVQDSVAMAIRIEHRYKGIRSPHKMKSAVSGCVRECAEAQSKDFSLIATENGYNVLVCGNGGTKPRHTDLLVADVSEQDAIKYLDRFIMFYISTADKLQRTSTWMDKMEGGIEYLRDVVVNDSLGIAEQLESDMQHLLDTYQCEWTSVVNDPALRAKFTHYANSEELDSNIEWVPERDHQRPADWDKAEAPQNVERLSLSIVQTSWVKVADVRTFPKDAGRTVKYGKAQIAVFNFSSRGEWYAVQNECPHRHDMVLSRGIIGDDKGEPKVACPLHKKTFSLQDGRCLTGEKYEVVTFPVKVEDGAVFLELPPVEKTEQLLSCDRLVRHQVAASSAAE